MVDSLKQEALGCPAEIAAMSEFEMDEIIDNRIFDNLGPFVVIGDGSEGGSKVKTGRGH